MIKPSKTRGKSRIYFAGVFLTAVCISLLLSNLRWIDQKIKSREEFYFGPTLPYASENGMLRYAVNDVSEEVGNTEILISSESNIESMVIHYQAVGDGTFIEVEPKLFKTYEQTKFYYLPGTMIAQNWYIDLMGELDETPTVSLRNHAEQFSVTPEGIAAGIIVLLFGLAVWNLRGFFVEMYNSRTILTILTKNDLKARYAGSFFGIVWSFAQPLFTIFIFWFVFQLGFKSQPVDNMPFILWFLPAYIPWLYVQDVVLNATGCMREYSYLVKKMKFRVTILPAIKVASSYAIHMCFAAIMFFAYAVYGVKPTWLYLQLIYYSVAMVVFVSGISWLIAAFAVFVKDFSQIVGIILQLGYFAIPVFWSEAQMEPGIIRILKLNPVYYIVQGYRDSMCGTGFFWDNPWYTIYFWVFALFVFWAGITLFERVKKHFADLL